jgi:hypothetical protein
LFSIHREGPNRTDNPKECWTEWYSFFGCLGIRKARRRDDESRQLCLAPSTYSITSSARASSFVRHGEARRAMWRRLSVTFVPALAAGI